VTAGTGVATLSTTFDNLSGGVIDIVSGALTSNAVLTNAATITGARLEITGGQATLAAGSSLTVQEIDLYNTASLSVTSALTYAGTFVDSSNGSNRLALSGGGLTLTGVTDFNSSFGADFVQGTGTLKLAHAATLDFGTVVIGGTVKLELASTFTADGTIQVGDSSSNAASAVIDKGAVYDLTADVGIVRGSSAASGVINDGLLEKTAGTGTSVISAKLINDGTITVTSGTLEIVAGDFFNNGTIDGTVTKDSSGDTFITAAKAARFAHTTSALAPAAPAAAMTAAAGEPWREIVLARPGQRGALA
jgi:hypothetical protein